VLPTIKSLLKEHLSAVESALGACRGAIPIQAQAATLLVDKLDDFVESFEKEIRASYTAEWEKKVKKVSKHYKSRQKGSFTRDTILDFMKLAGGSDVNEELHEKLCEYLSDKVQALQQLVMRKERHVVASSVRSIERRYVLLLRTI
jgi:hypothetical protein